MEVAGSNPSRFVHWLIAAMEARKVGVRQLAKYAGLSASGLSSLLRGETRPSMPTVLKLAEYFHVGPNELVDLLPPAAPTGSIPSSTIIGEATGILLVPVVEQEAGAGRGREVLDYEFVAPSITAKGRNVIAVRVAGDCMSPKIDDGDTVIVDRERGWDNGRVVLARVEDSLLIKRIYSEDGHVRLHCDNANYPDITGVEADVLGVVIRVIKVV